MGVTGPVPCCRAGEYRLELVATAGGTTQIVRRAVQMDAFAISPSSSAPKPGSQLTLLIRSAEPLDARRG